MKKCVTILLAIIMLMGTLPQAALAEELIYTQVDPETGYEAPVLEIGADTDGKQRLEDLGIAMPNPDDDWEAEWAAEMRQEKVDLGMSYPDGANISLNGKYLDFGGVAPQQDLNGNTLIPFRAFLEGLGGKVAYQDGKFIANMPDGVEITAEPDSTTLTYTVGDKISTLDMYTPPVVVERVTYVEGWSLAAALGLDVDEAYDYDVLHLTDWDAVAAEVDGRFATLNALLAAKPNTPDPEKAYLNRVNLTAAATLYGDKKDDTATMTLTGETLVKGGQVEVNSGLKLDLGGMKDTVFSALDEEQLALLDLLSDLKVNARGDLEQGSLYVKCNKLSEFPDSPITGDPWLAITTDEGMVGLLELLEEAPAELLGADQTRTVGSLLVNYCRNNGYYGYGGRSPYDEAISQAKELDVLLGDKNFTVTTAGSTTTYAVNMDKAKLEKRVAERLEEDKADGAWATLVDIPFVESEMPDITYTLTVRMREGKLVDCKLTGGVKWSGIPVEVTFGLSGNQNAATGTLNITGTYIGKLALKMDVKAGETTRGPLTEPGKGEVVLDLSALQSKY